MKKNIITYLCFFIGLVIISMIFIIDYDSVWTYGFSYNIANGSIPYKDFNMVIGPLYSLIFSVPIIIFGNHIYIFELAHIFIYSLIFVYIYKKIGLKSIFLLLVFAYQPSLSSYNIFCAMLLILLLLIYDNNSKYRQIFIGILIGVIFMTKHNIGLVLSLVYIFDNRKKILNLLSILIPIIPTLIYLIINNAFFGYINFSFLGAGDFINNFTIGIYALVIIGVFGIILLREYLKTKDYKIIYILAFHILLFPIINYDHLIPVLVPVIFYLFMVCDNRGCLYLKSYILFMLVFVTIIPLIGTTLIMDNSFLTFGRIYKGIDEYLINTSAYIETNKDDGYEVYYFGSSAYLLKIYNNQIPGFYDLINNGNLGKDKFKYIKKLDKKCKNNKCMFILDNKFFDNKNRAQNILEFKKYVIDNSEYLETLPSGDRVYVNK